jgi:hypothetical protein
MEVLAGDHYYFRIGNTTAPYQCLDNEPAGAGDIIRLFGDRTLAVLA